MPCKAIISGILIYPPHFFIGFLPKFHFQWYLFPPLLVFFFIFFFLFSTFLSILSKIYFFCVLPNLNCPYIIIYKKTKKKKKKITVLAVNQPRA